MYERAREHFIYYVKGGPVFTSTFTLTPLFYLPLEANTSMADVSTDGAPSPATGDGILGDDDDDDDDGDGDELVALATVGLADSTDGGGEDEV